MPRLDDLVSRPVSSIQQLAADVRQKALSGLSEPQGAPESVTPVPQVPRTPEVSQAPLPVMAPRSPVTQGLIANILSPQVDAFEAAMDVLRNGGQGGSGSPLHDVDAAIGVRVGQLSSSSTPVSGSYSDLMGKYGQLIDPKAGPSDLRLQAGALRSLQGTLPLGAILPGSYRSNAQQTALYARDPNRYASPGHSLHEYGLAIDVNSNYLADHPEVRQALLARGWYQERPDEPWHFSYGFFSPVPSVRTNSGGGNPSSGQSTGAQGSGRRRNRAPKRTVANTAKQRM